MKKLLTALTAAVMLGTLLTAPVSAEETAYKMGDVNMDGFIGADDAQLVLVDFLWNMVFLPENRVLTEEQIALGNVDLRTFYYEGVDGDGNPTSEEYVLSAMDAQLILFYYLESTVTNPDAEQLDVVTWVWENHPYLYEDLSDN